MARAADPAVAARLRERLGLAPLPRPTFVARDLRALRYALQMTRRDFATYLGLSPRTIEAYETDGRAIRAREDVRKKLQHALDVARELGALTHDPGKRERYERPPNDLEYRCTACGLPLQAERVRKVRGDWMHGSRPCGPVMPGGPIHRARVLAVRAAEQRRR